jgi:hypothetical protein
LLIFDFYGTAKVEKKVKEPKAKSRNKRRGDFRCANYRYANEEV